MRTIPYYQVDAFTSELFRGNPAGVCMLSEEWLPDDLMQRIAFENNLSETAFVLPQGNIIGLRWFTPQVEIDLCGHATLASAFILFTELRWADEIIQFNSRSGILKVVREGFHYVLDFPARPGQLTEAPPDLVAGLGKQPKEVYKARDWMAVYDSEEEIREVDPDFELLANIPGGKAIITAPGRECDFVSRFFAPGAGVDEDPVTGSAHCTLIPFWAQRIGRRTLRARQLSERGGELLCEMHGERVGIGGHAVLYSAGQLYV